MILFCVLFGLSMDYEVFLLSRMKEVWDRTGDNREAVARGLERSGRIVTSAALIVVVVAGSFAFADIVLIKALGLGRRDRRRPRRDGRPGAARAGDDAPARRLELVAAGRLSARRRRCRRRGRARRGVDAAVAPASSSSAAAVAGCAGGGPILANPTAPRPPSPPPTADARRAPPTRSPSRCRATTARTTA